MLPLIDRDASGASRPIVTVSLASLAALGEAVGRLPEGRVVFVPGGAPGDLAEVELVEQRKGYARGRLLRVISPGPGRVTPACPLSSGRCGGCPWMHVDRQGQLAAKEELVRGALRHTGAEVLPILAPTPDLHFRIRARLVLRGGRLGFQAARSHDVLDLVDCPAMVPALASALSLAAARLRQCLGEEGTLSGVVGAGDAVHLAAAVGRGGDRAGTEAALRALVDEGHGMVVGASLSGWHPGAGRASLSGWHHGAAAVDVGGAAGTLWASGDSFAQASEAGHGELLTQVQRALGSPGEGVWPRVLELYAGAGNLTRAIRSRAGGVVAVESDPVAAARLGALSGVKVLSRQAEQAVLSLRDAGERFDAAVLDPPRTGAAAVMGLLSALGVRRVVYVSCDPMTLGRDLTALRGHGFAVRWAQPIDLLPHSAHVEIVALAEAQTPP